MHPTRLATLNLKSRTIVAAMPPGYFAPSHFPLLAQLCRHCVASDRIAALIEVVAAKKRIDISELTSLHTAQSSESAAIVRLSRQLRLTCAFRRFRPPIPTDRDQLFRLIATSAARVLTAPLDDGCDVSLLGVGQARREAVPVVNRRDPRAPRRALTADAAARAGGPC